jgi:hypothetical protein
VSDPAGARVTIDGVRQALITPSTYRVARARHYLVRVEKEGFVAQAETVEVPDGQGQRAIATTLKPLPSKKGGLRVRTNAKKASFKLDGADVGDGSGTLELADLAPGTHRLSVSARGFSPREEPVEVRAGPPTSIEWTLAATPTHHTRPTPKSGAPAGVDSDATSGWPPQ